MTERSMTGHYEFEAEIKRLVNELDKYTKSKKVDPKGPHNINSIRERLGAFVIQVKEYPPGDPIFQVLTDMSRLSYEVGRYCGKDPVVEGKRTKPARDVAKANRKKKESERKARVIACAQRLTAENPSLRSDIDRLAGRVESKLRGENKEEKLPPWKKIIEWVREARLTARS
jgi:hypothetical protein